MIPIAWKSHSADRRSNFQKISVRSSNGTCDGHISYGSKKSVLIEKDSFTRRFAKQVSTSNRKSAEGRGWCTDKVRWPRYQSVGWENKRCLYPEKQKDRAWATTESLLGIIAKKKESSESPGIHMAARWQRWRYDFFWEAAQAAHKTISAAESLSHC